MTPAVSIVVPAFNAAATLDAALDSVFAQSMSDWEIIVADDGSTDETAAIALKRMRDDRVRMVSTDHRGPSYARNVAVELAQAPWLLFLDADDLILPEHLATMLAAANGRPQPDFIYSGFSKLTPDGRLSPPNFPPAADHFHHLCKYNPFFPAACLVRHDVFSALGGFDTSLMTSEEWDLWQRIARAGGVFSQVDRCLAHYRMHPESLSRKAELLFRDARTVIMRGHARDSRVENPAPQYAEGTAPAGLDQALAGIMVWCAATIIGIGNDPKEFVSNAALPALRSLDRDPIVTMMEYGVPHGACGLQTDWPQLWQLYKVSIQSTFVAIEQRCGIPGLADECLREFRRRIAV